MRTVTSIRSRRANLIDIYLHVCFCSFFVYVYVCVCVCVCMCVFTVHNFSLTLGWYDSELFEIVAAELAYICCHQNNVRSCCAWFHF